MGYKPFTPVPDETFIDARTLVVYGSKASELASEIKEAMLEASGQSVDENELKVEIIAIKSSVTSLTLPDTIMFLLWYKESKDSEILIFKGRVAETSSIAACAAKLAKSWRHGSTHLDRIQDYEHQVTQRDLCPEHGVLSTKKCSAQLPIYTTGCIEDKKPSYCHAPMCEQCQRCPYEDTEHPGEDNGHHG